MENFFRHVLVSREKVRLPSSEGPLPHHWPSGLHCTMGILADWVIITNVVIVINCIFRPIMQIDH
jgi:hypothetical protein